MRRMIADIQMEIGIKKIDREHICNNRVETRQELLSYQVILCNIDVAIPNDH